MTDAFGKVPSWHLPPGSVIPADRQYMNKPNAVFLSSHPNLSIRTQAKEHLDGIESLQRPYVPDEYELNMWYLSLDEEMRKDYEVYMGQFGSQEEYFNDNNKKGQ